MIWLSELPCIFTACKRSCGKVMFLQVSVILLMGGGIPSCLAPALYKQLHCWWVLSWWGDSIQVTSNAWWDRSHGTPPLMENQPPWMESPPRWRTPPWMETPLGWRTPLDGEPPPLDGDPPWMEAPLDGGPPGWRTPQMENPPGWRTPPVWRTPPGWRTPPKHRKSTF